MRRTALGSRDRNILESAARVVGVDEVGRGCLAGPVAVCGVAFEQIPANPMIQDSKTLTTRQRERAAEWITGNCSDWVVLEVWPEVIDRINILEATRRAMREALRGLDPRPDAALVDAVKLGECAFPCLGMVRGDSLSYAVACASILAKESRDRLMEEADRRFPHYGFVDNKGYAAPVHLQALSEYGPSPVHRLTFRSVLGMSLVMGMSRPCTRSP